MPAFPSLQDALSLRDIVKIPSSKNPPSTWARRQFSVFANPQLTSSPNSNFPDLNDPLSMTSQASLLPSSPVTPQPPSQSPSSSSSSTSFTFSLNFGTATPLPSYTKPTSNSTPGAASDSATGTSKNLDAKPIIFGVLSGVFGLLILIAILYCLLRHRHNKSRRKEMHDTFWERWHWGTYSPLHEDVVVVNRDLTTTEDVSGNGEQSNKPTTSWWQRFKFSGSGGADGSEKVGKKARKQRSEKIHKVKRLKPSDKFEIDSEAHSSVVGLTAYTR